MLSVAFGGKLGKEAIKKIFSRIQSKQISSKKIKEIQNVIKKAQKDALDKEKASVAWSDIATDHFDKTARVLKQGEEAYKRVKGKAKGGYVKKYAKGGGVRKVRTCHAIIVNVITVLMIVIVKIAHQKIVSVKKKY